jgi:hypothetical protein
MRILLRELFKENWPSIREGRNSRTPQDRSKGTTHRKTEIGGISGIDLDRAYQASDLINLLRARTYPPYPSAYYAEGEKRSYVRIELLREPDLAALRMPRSASENFPRGDLTSNTVQPICSISLVFTTPLLIALSTSPAPSLLTSENSARKLRLNG